MKRSLAALVSLSIILVSAPTSAWSQVYGVASGAQGSASSAAGASVTGGVSGVNLQMATPSMTPALGGSLLAAPMASAPSPLVMKRAPIDPTAPVETKLGAAIAVPLLSEVPSVLSAASKPVFDGKAAAEKPALKPVTADAKSLSDARREVADAAGAIEKGSTANSRWAGSRLFDRLLGLEEAGDREPAVEGLPPAGILSAQLSSSEGHEPAGFRQGNVPSPGSNGPGPRRTKIGGFVKGVGAAVLGAAFVIGAQAAAVALLPAVFGVVPVAAVWAVSSGLLLFPLALYARYRLAKRDSPRLNKVKTLLDFSLGAFMAAAFVAVPSLGVVLTTANLATAALPLAAVAGGRWLGGSALADSALTWAALGLTPALVGVAAATGLIGLAPIIGLMALPAMTTIAFFLGRLINAAETGQPFAVPGTMQKLRFPSFQWVMIGVVFGLLTGFSAVHTNIAFLAWNFLGSREIKWDKSLPLLKRVLGVLLSFDTLYLGLLAFTAIGGFASPLTFLVIAFSGERAAVWTERLLSKFLPKGAAAPSTREAPVADPDTLADKPPKWPAFHYRVKTFVMLGTMAATGVMLSTFVFGISSLLTNLAIASVLAFIPFFFAKNIIKLMMKAKPTTRDQDPEFFSIMDGLRDKINAGRRAAGQKEIPMPDMVIDPMEAPNAYATGRSPFAAMVGVTRGIKAMTLEPENVRDGVVRLIAASDPGTKEFKVFRRAIAGSVTGVPADATPAQVASAVLKADRSELKALGVRMLRGVLGHEFSHVMDRHMLTGSIGGAIASGVAFASYGVMWAVGHAQIAVKKAFGWRPKSPAAESLESRSGSNDQGVRPEALDPISTGVIIKSLPALLRLFAALWSPVVLQILQMAASRNNEGMADEDGALLSEDPESLALALGLLTTWRPPAGFRLPGAAVPRAASMQHVMIVNPLEQLENAGALPKSSASGGPTRADDLIFELFITHPNTGVRIRKLHDMSEALRGLRPAKPTPPQDPPPNPPDDSGGGHKLSFLGPNAAPGRIGGGLLRGAWAGLKGLFRVLPDEGRNRQFWIFAAGQGLIMLGVNFHYTALPKLVAPTKEQAANLGYNRAINWGAQAASSLVTGPLIDRTSTQKTIIWTGVARAALMMLIPVLFFHGFFGFAAFAGLIAVAGFLQMAGTTAGTVAFNRILGDDVDRYNRANAVLTIVMNAVGVVGPLLAGAFIASMDAKFGLLSGNALAYAVYGAMMLACSIGYALFLKLPRDEMMAARRELAEVLKRDGVGDAKYTGVAGARENGKPVLLVEIDGDPSAAVVPATFAGIPVKAVAKRRVFNEVAEGFRTIFSDRFLRLYLLSTTLAVMAGDALIFAALPRFLEDILKAGAGAFGLFLAAASLGSGIGSGLMAFARDPERTALLPVARPFRAALSLREPGLDDKTLDAAKSALSGSVATVLARYKGEWKAGAGAKTAGALAVDTLAEAAKAVGEALGRTEAEAAALLEVTGASRGVRDWASRRGLERLNAARAEAAGGMDALQRQGRWTSWLHGLSWLAYTGLFFSGSVPLAVGLMLLSTTLGAPAAVAWTSLTTKVVQGTYGESQAKIYSAMFFYQLVFAIAGVLFFGWLMAMLATTTVLWIAGGVMLVCALIDFLSPALIFPIGRK